MRCPSQGYLFPHEETLKLSTRIARSRHGIYYYRHPFTVDGKRREKRFSLRTRPSEFLKALGDVDS
ncbi:protein of unknown function [Burkholderia multivorans]